MVEAATSRNPAPGYEKHPDYFVESKVSPKWVRVVFNGETVADSKRALIMRENRHTPVYYFPRDDVRMDRAQPTDTHTHCPFKGEASYWTLKVGDRSDDDVMWSYETPYDEALEIKDHIAFYWNKMDRWFEEDEEIFVHARDPHVRIDALRSSRSVRIVHQGVTLADTTRPVLLFETGLRTRYYIPAEDVMMDPLTSSSSETACPYKGTASYWSLKIGDEVIEDLVWAYPDPLPECTAIKGLLCFYDDKVDEVIVDGTPIT